ncbi:MAG TPA: hypothetical protein VLV88_12930 [Terriglobales bacterium]|nr:hypothetical protein [Terriglobales bacterium]
MKSKSPAFTTRCSYRTAAGRQCRSLSQDPRSGLCPQHLLKQNEFADLTEPLLLQWQGFQTAQGVNYTLSNLYKLLAAGHISARRAAVLAYISNLLLRTLPAIDHDRHAGIQVPAAFRERPITVPHEEDIPDTETELEQTEDEAPGSPDAEPQLALAEKLA